MATPIKAAVCHGFQEPLKVETITLADPQQGEVMVKISACAVCFSDISYMDGGWGGHLPAVYGHEAAGTITATGAGVTDYAVGDRVIVTLIRSCGTCPSCITAHPTTCTTYADNVSHPLSTDTGPVFKAMNSGAFAEAVVVDTSQIVKIPDDVPMEAAALLSCGVITGVGAVVNAAGLRAGQTAVVIGAGGVGLNAIQGARIAGASRIVAVDMTEDKLDTARAFGATDGVLATDPKPWKAAAEILGGGADHVFVTVGAIPAYDVAPRYLAPQGKLTMVGMPHGGEKASYNPDIAAAIGLEFIGTKMGSVILSRDIPWMIDLYQQGRLKLDELISGRWSLDQINEAIADTRRGTAGRNVIIFDD